MPEIGLFGSEGGAPTHGVPTLSAHERGPGLQNSDSSPRLGDSRQSEPRPTGQLALDPKNQSQDRDGRPFGSTG